VNPAAAETLGRILEIRDKNKTDLCCKLRRSLQMMAQMVTGFGDIKGI